MTPKDLASVSWRDDMIANGECETQKFARRLIAAGYAALLVPSFARAPRHRPQSRALALGRRRADPTRSHRRREPSLMNLPASPTRLGQIIMFRRSGGA